jgi:Ala-tRNA(Pro) deacylase
VNRRRVTAHPLAYTAREVASVEHVPAREVAKTVIYLSEGGYGMAVLPADSVVDLEQLRLDLGFSRLRLATEGELAELFSTCELGADDTITFNAGTHRDVIHMQFADFKRLVNPEVAPFSRRVGATA